MAIKRNYSMSDRSISAIGGVVPIRLLPFQRSGSSGLDLTDWLIDESGAEWIANTGENYLRFPVPHHPDVKISTLTAVIIPEVAGRAGLPAEMPSIELQGYSISGVAGTNMTQADTSATVGAYEAPHLINLNVPSAEGFMSDQTFEARFKRESGANAEFGLRLVKFYLTVFPARSL